MKCERCSKPIPLYHFKDIPNDDDGKRFVSLLRKHLNKDRYTMRVRGQHRDHSKLGYGEKHSQWGTPIKHSKNLRVYIGDNAR